MSTVAAEIRRKIHNSHILMQFWICERHNSSNASRPPCRLCILRATLMPCRPYRLPAASPLLPLRCPGPPRARPFGLPQPLPERRVRKGGFPCTAPRAKWCLSVLSRFCFLTFRRGSFQKCKLDGRSPRRQLPCRSLPGPNDSSRYSGR